jgi:pyrroline-5-carboxylate reductase
MADLTKLTETVGFVGAGNMATALIRGLIQEGFPPDKLMVADLDASKSTALSDELGVHSMKTAVALAESSNVMVLAVKPQGICPLLGQLKEHSSKCLWISIAAGVSTKRMEAELAPGSRVIRVMPNTPALIGEGASGLCRGRHATDQDAALAHLLLSAVGICEQVSEEMMDAVTGVSGSGPAYVMLVIEAMADGGVRAGLPRATALRLAAQTVRGAAALLLSTGKHPGELKDMVTSPGGTTIAGVAALEEAGLRNALIAAVTAATLRSRELSG